MNPLTHEFSTNTERNKYYTDMMADCARQKRTLKDIIQLGNRLMRKAKLHRHFFFKPTFLERLYGTTYMLPTAQYLALFALKLPYEHNSKHYMNKKLTPEEALAIIHLFEKRIDQRCPVEYITHECSYMGRKFYVNSNVLVPRSLMSSRFDEFLKGITWENYSVLDLCAGSGCIGITLALMDPRIKVDLADISAEALTVAQVNIDQHHLQDRVRCIQSDLFSQISGKYDLIITNPPYVAAKAVGLGPSELTNEPSIALDGGQDGLRLVNNIIRDARQHLNEKGQLIAEVGFSAPKLLKKRYPHIFTWLTPKPAAGEESIFDFFLYSGHCVFMCDAKNLELNQRKC